MFTQHTINKILKSAFLGAFLYPSLAFSAPELVIETQTGNILHEKEATQAWHPASLTKLMTTYVALKTIAQKQLIEDNLVVMSAKATKAPPSKMGFRPGTKFSVTTAIKILMVKSANDVSVALAEHISGSTENFVQRMNTEAKRLGMYQTHFVNPHGLPASKQQTSARDMAILAMALLQEFPQYEKLFSIPALRLGNKIMRNHNGLIGRFEGAAGMKTGFICASGFNVVARTIRDDKDVITIVLGATSSHERTERAAEITETNLKLYGKARSGSILHLAADSNTPPPDIREWVCNKKNKNYRADLEAAVENFEDYELSLSNPLQDLKRMNSGTYVPASYLGHNPSSQAIEEIKVIEPPAPPKTKNKSKSGNKKSGAKKVKKNSQ